MRIGFGFDIHQLREGLDFSLGGMIPYEKVVMVILMPMF